MAARELDVHLDGALVGRCSQTSAGAIAFDYDPDYTGLTPLSLSMPRTASHHGNRVVRAFLEGLLPDSPEALQAMGTKYGVSWRNPMAILEHAGRDTAGAVQFGPPGESVVDAGPRRRDVEWLSDAEFAELMRALVDRSRDWDILRAHGRWSLAGAQSKVALFHGDDGRWGTPRDATPTTHILKPGITGFVGHALNEHLCARAAALLGLRVAESELLEIEGVGTVLVSSRYDRVEQGGVWRRRHQEDLCQALGVRPEQKYQADGGPGVAEIADLLRLVAPATATASLERFYDALVFNIGIMGTDAHAKNYAVLLDGRNVELAPLYDLGSFTPYRLDADRPGARPPSMPMKIGDEWSLHRIGVPQLVAAGRRIGLHADWAEQRARQLLVATAGAFADAAEETALGHPALAVAARSIAEAVDVWSRERGFDLLDA